MSTALNSIDTAARFATTWLEPVKTAWAGFEPSSMDGRVGKKKAASSRRTFGRNKKPAIAVVRESGWKSKGALEHERLKQSAMTSLPEIGPFDDGSTWRKEAQFWRVG